MFLKYPACLKINFLSILLFKDGEGQRSRPIKLSSRPETYDGKAVYTGTVSTPSPALTGSRARAATSSKTPSTRSHQSPGKAVDTAAGDVSVVDLGSSSSDTNATGDEEESDGNLANKAKTILKESSSLMCATHKCMTMIPRVS